MSDMSLALRLFLSGSVVLFWILYGVDLLAT